MLQAVLFMGGRFARGAARSLTGLHPASSQKSVTRKWRGPIKTRAVGSGRRSDAGVLLFQAPARPGGAEEALSAVLLSPSETIGSFERDWLLALYEEHLKAPATRRSAALNRFLQAAARLLARSKPISVLQVWVFGGRVCLGLREC